MPYKKEVIAKAFEKYKCNVKTLRNNSVFDTTKKPLGKEYKDVSVSFEQRRADCLKLIPALESGRNL